MKEKEQKNKKKIDKTRLATKIIAAFLALIFVVSICTTVVYYLIG